MDFPEGLQSMDETICLDHIKDHVLKTLASSSVSEHACSFCDRRPDDTTTPFAVPMDVVADRVYEAARYYYGDISDAPWPPGQGSEMELDTRGVVGNVTHRSFEDTVSDEVIDSLVKAIVSPSLWFEDDKRGLFAYSWGQFVETVRRETRFVFMSTPRPGGADEPPARLSRFLEGLLGYADKRTRMLTLMPEGTKLYRGRMTDDPRRLRAEVDKEPAQQLGVAPAERASAGRMSAEGVPLFYAADNPRTAVSEIALHSRYDDAVVGEFVTQRQLMILDFTLKPTLPSIYAKAARDQRMFVAFVGDFVNAITKPVILDGRERVDYLPTQVVTEFLRWVPERRIDGIAFPSRADADGKNIVIFDAKHLDHVVTDPPTAKERVMIDRAARAGQPKEPSLTISQRGITEHRVTRHVIVHSR